MNGTVKGTLGPKSSMTHDLHLHHFNFNVSTANLFGLKKTVGEISTAEDNKPNFFLMRSRSVVARQLERRQAKKPKPLIGFHLICIVLCRSDKPYEIYNIKPLSGFLIVSLKSGCKNRHKSQKRQHIMRSLFFFAGLYFATVTKKLLPTCVSSGLTQKDQINADVRGMLASSSHFKKNLDLSWFRGSDVLIY